MRLAAPGREGVGVKMVRFSWPPSKEGGRAHRCGECVGHSKNHPVTVLQTSRGDQPSHVEATGDTAVLLGLLQGKKQQVCRHGFVFALSGKHTRNGLLYWSSEY